MSGTSVDAIDAVLVRIEGNARDGARIEKLRFASFGFPPEIQTRIKLLFERERDRKLTDPKPASTRATSRRSAISTSSSASCSRGRDRLIAEAGMKTDDVDLIAAAGQTIWHRPRPTTEPSTAELPWLDEPIATRSTLAIGQSAVIAERTGIITIGDLRVRDVAAGGHGAPLVAYFDWALLRHPKLARAACRTSAASATSRTSRRRRRSDDVIAFDTGPGNMVIDCARVHGHRTARRRSTATARSPRAARVREDVLDVVHVRSVLSNSAAEDDRARAVRRAVRARGSPSVRRTCRPDDLIATATAFTAESIARAYRDFIGRRGRRGDRRRRRREESDARGHAARADAATPRSEVYEYLQAKEAMAMAIIANDSVAGMHTNVAGATGGRPTVLGKICL